MKKRSLRILSIVMVLVMLFSVTATSAMAAETNIGKGEQQLIMEQMGYETKTLEFATATTEKFSFVTPEGIDSVVEKVILSNGDEVYDITEGDIKDVLIIKPNGDIYLDGNLVKIVSDSTLGVSSKSVSDDVIIMPRAQRHEFKTECPYDAPAAYDDLTDYERKTLLLEQIIREITLFAFKQIVMYAMNMVVPGCSAIVDDIFSYIIDEIKAYNPVADAFSMQYYRYVHVTEGFTVTSNMSVAKYVMGFYKDLNFGLPIKVDNSSAIVAYEVFTY